MFERITLPYSYEALEPAIDRETVQTHYEKHHKTYTEKFNALLEKAPALKGMSALQILRNLDKAPQDIRQGLRNNGGGYLIHNLYFESLTPGGKKPDQDFIDKAKECFGSFDDLVKKLQETATVTLFGSGWAWLVSENGKLSITLSHNQDLPEGDPKLLLPLDMWEHAYYLKYKNEKVKYAEAFFNIVDWSVVAGRM